MNFSINDQQVTLRCPHDDRYRIEMDASEIDREDPGNGTPLMVYGLHGSSATYMCARETGEMSSSDSLYTLPDDVWDWLVDIEEKVWEWLDHHEGDAA